MSVSNPNSAFSYSFGTTTVGGQSYVDLSITQLAVAGVWATNGPGNWSNSANWSGGVPQNAGDTATFASTITSSATVTLDQAETVASLTFTNTASYTISGTNALTLSSTAGATINNTLGSHYIAAPLNLATNTGALISNGATLTLSGAVSGTGSLTKNGNGTLVLSASNGYGPAAGAVGTTINAGTVQLGNNSALSTGDVSFAGTGTIQAGANGLVLANNLIIAGSATATLDTQGNALTVAGVISESAASGSLTKNGSGTLILTASNTYTGTTTINAGTLQLDNGGSTGYVAGPIVDNGTLALDRGDTGLVLPGVISGSGNLAQVGTGMSTLAGANIFSGNTIISAGTLQLANSLGLQDSTLIYNNQGGLLSFGTLTAASVGALTGSQSLVLQNASSAAVALTVGGNNQTTTYSGNLSDLGVGGSLTKTGFGTFTLTSSNSYTGGTNVNGGTVVLFPGASIVGGAITLPSLVGSTLDVNGGTVIAGGTSSILGSDGLYVTSGSVAFGDLHLFTDNRNNGGILSITGGTVTAANIDSGRTSLNNSTQPAAGSTTLGLYVNGGMLNVNGNVNLGTGVNGGNTNSSVSLRIDSGAVNVSGTISIGLNNGGRWSVLDVNGGALTSTDTGSGIQLGGPSAGDAEFLVRAGVANVQLVTFGQGAVADTVVLNLTGGQLYVGSGGMVLGSASATPEIYLAGGTLGAAAPWSSDPSLPITLTGGSVAGVTIQTADASGNPQNITLNGADLRQRRHDEDRQRTAESGGREYLYWPDPSQRRHALLGQFQRPGRQHAVLQQSGRRLELRHADLRHLWRTQWRRKLAAG